MLPAIFISTVSSVISGIMKDSPYASMAVSTLTAFNAFILAIITYLKLDAKAEAFKSSAYSYDKLQTVCEFHSGRILLNTCDSSDASASMVEILNDIEKGVIEIKDRNQFIVPSYIRNIYPKLYFTNIFTIVKHIQNEEMIHINNLKVVMNRGIDIVNEILKGDTSEEMKLRQSYHYDDKNRAINNLIQFREKFLDIDSEFKEEIQKNINRRNIRWYNCWCKYSSCTRSTEEAEEAVLECGRPSLDNIPFPVATYHLGSSREAAGLDRRPD
jgi:hypothetical protein